MLDRLRNTFSYICQKVAYGAFGFICFYLFLLSIFSTCVIWYDTESTYYMKDFPLLLIAGLIGLIGLTFFCRKLVLRILNQRMLFMGIATLIWLFLVAVFVWNTDIELVYDQLMVKQAMLDFLDGEYSMWQQGGYMYAYPFQNSLALIYIPLAAIFRDNIYVAVQAVNVLFMVFMAVGIYKLGKVYFGIHVAAFSYVGTLFFFPLWGYIKYMYGNLPGLSLTVWAIYLLVKYIQTEKWKYIGGSALCTLFALAYKGTFLIYLIAMLIILLVEAISQKKKWYLCAAAILLAAGLIGTNGSSFVMHKVTGYMTNEGIPKTHCIAMGLQESYVAPGWYGGDSMKWFAENNFSQEACIQEDLGHISDSFRLFRQEKAYGLRFFSRKIASEWNNPTFECFAVVVKGNLHGTIDYWMKDILYSGGIGNTLLTIIMDIMQSVYLFGAILYLMYCWKDHSLYKAIPLVALTGGFLLHLFWEAKCQYTIIYFVILIPYAFTGYQECIRRLVHGLSRRPGKARLYKSKAVWAAGILLAIILGIGLCDNTFVNSTIKLGGGGGDYIWLCREQDYWRSDDFTKEGPREE